MEISGSVPMNPALGVGVMRMDREEIRAALRSGVEQQRLRALRDLALARKQRAAKTKKEIQRLYQAYRKAGDAGDAVAISERIDTLTKQLASEAAMDRKLFLGR